MKIAIVSTYDIEGGAGRAAHRLHHALQQSGVESAMFVQHRADADPSVNGPFGNVPKFVAQLRWRADHFPAGLLGVQRGLFAVNWLGVDLRQRLQAYAPDVVHLHWVNAGFVSLSGIASLAVPVVMTAHDMWPFTGGCHYDAGCGRYASAGCERCPMQTRLHWLPIAQRRLNAKAVAYRAGDLRFVCPSRWLAKSAQKSPVTRGRSISVIPNAIDISRFKPVDRRAARDLYNLSPDATIVLFGALNAGADTRKGFAQLDAALRALAGNPTMSNVQLCIFGSAFRGNDVMHGFPVRHVGRLFDEEALVALYSAADVFVAPSLQDNLPNTVLEATACGIPTVAFDIGGMSDLIEHRHTGWLATPDDPLSLADGILFAAKDKDWRVSAGLAARRSAEQQFSYATVAAAHDRLYHETLKSWRGAA